MLGRPPHERDIARLGKIVTLFLVNEQIRYTVMLTDGRLMDLAAPDFVVEK